MAVVSATVLFGCAKESTTPSNTSKNYLPSSAGTYYIHENSVKEKSSTGSDSVTMVYTDSTTVDGTEQKTDSKGTTKTAVRYVVYAGFTSETDTVYMAQEGGKLYQLVDLSYSMGGAGTLDLGTAWILVHDQGSATWTAYEDSVSNLTIDYQGSSIPVTVKIRIAGSSIGEENMTVDGKSVATSHSLLNLNLTMYVPVFGNVTVNVAIHNWFGTNVGLVKSDQPPVTFSILGFGEETVSGMSSLLVRYSVK